MKNNENEKLKVGILTFHRAHNYGAVLQCYALQETLKSLGYDVWVIDYRQKAIERAYKFLSLHNLISKVKLPNDLYVYITSCFNRKKRGSLFNNFRKTFLNLTNPCHSSNDIPNMDLYIVGSDQVWNARITKGVDDVYWGNTSSNKRGKFICYAVSANFSTATIEEHDKIKRCLNNFSVISFRENKSKKYLLEIFGVNSRIDIDPVVLANKNVWNKMFANNDYSKIRYVLLYQVRYRKGEKDILVQKAKQLAIKLQCTLIDVSDLLKFSPSDFVSLVKTAQYVVTSSFHAAVFSVIFQRPLYAVKLHDGHDERYVDFLESVGLGNLLVDLDFDPEPRDRDYSKSIEAIKSLKEKSILYLQNIKNEI